MLPTGVSERTQATYKQVYDRLVQGAMSLKDQGDTDQQVGPIDVIGYLEKQWPNWKKGTQSQYKSAVLYVFREIMADLILIERVHTLDCDGGKGDQAEARKTGFPPEIRQSIMNHVSASYSTKGILTEKWIRAGVLTGLRPDEWRAAVLLDSFEDDEGNILSPALKVKNAKRKTGDDRKPFRYLGLNHMSDMDIESIRIFMSLLKIHEGNFDAVKRAVSRRIALAAKDIDGADGITLYSTRHQFAANAKTYNNQVTVAALMGHLSMIDTPSRYASVAASELGGHYPKGVWTISALPTPDSESLREMKLQKSGRDSWLADPIAKTKSESKL